MSLPPDLPAQAHLLASRRVHLPAQGTTLYRAAHTTETGGLYSLEVAGEVGVLSLYAELAAEVRLRVS